MIPAGKFTNYKNRVGRKVMVKPKSRIWIIIGTSLCAILLFYMLSGSYFFDDGRVTVWQKISLMMLLWT
jgi:hypothetical protein